MGNILRGLPSAEDLPSGRIGIDCIDKRMTGSGSKPKRRAMALIDGQSSREPPLDNAPAPEPASSGALPKCVP